MKQFFKFFFASLLAIFVCCLFTCLVIFIMASLGDDKPEVQPNSVLHIKLNRPIVDRAEENPFKNFNFGSMESESKIGLNNVLKNIKKATKDDNIKGIYLNLLHVDAGFATLEEIRDALIEFKDSSDKFIITYGEVYTQKAYYLASVADEIYLYPEGMLDFRGLSSTRTFFKGLLDKLEIEAQIIRHGKYKSAVEPFMLDSMSVASKKQTMKYVGDLWSHYLKGISDARGISVEKLNEIADSMLIRKAPDAVKFGLADAVIFKDELLAKLREKLGVEEDGDIECISLRKYTKVPVKKEESDLKKEKVAVIYAQGGIESGEGDEETIGSERISKAIRKAREDEKVKAIVLRVNSPGGSALASDVIWREMVLAKAEKPVVVSMGDVAASGGYYIACAADTIVASENTITGSIGVLGIIPNFREFFKNKMGITFDGVKTNHNADLGFLKPLTKTQKRIIKEGVVDVYQVFTSKVAEGRGMTQADVDSIGQGRVWSGMDAMRIGLIDVYGGLTKAIEIAADMADLEEYRVSEYPKKKDAFDELIKEFLGGAQTDMMQQHLGKNYKYFNYLKEVSKMQGIQARLPYFLEIE
ncbi:MAG: signal peptide peptidase SppA [Flavobacteriales bacterium]|nr:MAG: signal peptide peptidase SppA [Flavobacteriales bacterium]